MENVWPILEAVLLASVGFVGWALTLLGMPGTWLMVAAAALYAWQGPQAGAMQVSWLGVAGLAALAAVGEALESLFGMWTAKRAGGSRRASWFALLGSLAGAIGGAGLGIPIPVIGSLVGAVLGGAFGAMGGAVLAEFTRGERHRHSWHVGQAAFKGRLLGTGAKAIVATAMLAAMLIALAW